MIHLQFCRAYEAESPEAIPADVGEQSLSESTLEIDAPTKFSGLCFQGRPGLRLSRLLLP